MFMHRHKNLQEKTNVPSIFLWTKTPKTRPTKGTIISVIEPTNETNTLNSNHDVSNQQPPGTGHLQLEVLAHACQNDLKVNIQQDPGDENLKFLTDVCKKSQGFLALIFLPKCAKLCTCTDVMMLALSEMHENVDIDLPNSTCDGINGCKKGTKPATNIKHDADITSNLSTFLPFLFSVMSSSSVYVISVLLCFTDWLHIGDFLRSLLLFKGIETNKQTADQTQGSFLMNLY